LIRASSGAEHYAVARGVKSICSVTRTAEHHCHSRSKNFDEDKRTVARARKIEKSFHSHVRRRAVHRLEGNT